MMEALSEIGSFLVRTFGGLFFLAVLLRFLLQIARADFYNPISQSLVKLTNPLLKPLRRVIPGMLGIDMAALVLALLIKLTMNVLLLVFNGVFQPNIALLLVWSVLACIVAIFNIYYFALLVSIITSWVAQGSHNPAVVLIQQLTEPIMAPFRRLLPPMGGIDFSPMLAFAAIYILQILLRAAAAHFGLPSQFFLGFLVLGI
jgi:YggT family protein